MGQLRSLTPLFIACRNWQQQTRALWRTCRLLSTRMQTPFPDELVSILHTLFLRQQQGRAVGGLTSDGQEQSDAEALVATPRKHVFHLGDRPGLERFEL